MSKQGKLKQQSDLLVGKWFNGDEISSDVEFEITRRGDSYRVFVRDSDDGEAADVHAIAWDGRLLSFAAYWNSSGRFVRYRLLVLSANRIDVTYTSTDSQMYHRRKKK